MANIAPNVLANFKAAMALLTEWGYPVKTRLGYTTNEARGDLTFDPKGIINHRTGGDGTTDKMLFVDGNGHVDGPLCHFTVYRDDIDGKATIVLGAAGYANHAGNNDQPSVEKVLAGAPLDHEIDPGADDSYSANRRTIGIEVKAGKSWTPAQLESGKALNAALVMAFGWNRELPPIGSHKEITDRKPNDPDHDMAQFRRDVVEFILAKTAEPTPEPEEPPVLPPPPVYPSPSRPAGALPTLRSGSRGTWVKYLQQQLIKKFPALSKSIVSTGGADGIFGSGTVTAVKLVQKVIGVTADGIVGPKTWNALAKYGI